VGEDSEGHQSGRRVTVDEAARLYGLTVDAIRKRVQRGKIPHEKDGAGRVRIILDESETLQDESPDSTGQHTTGTIRDELIEELRDRVRYLEGQVEEERSARYRADELLARLMDRAQLEAPQEASEAPETVEEAPEEGHATAAREAREELGFERGRRERAETTMHEGMAEERRRREEAERERDDLRQELYALRRPPEAAETVEEASDRAEPRSDTAEAQEPTRALGSRGSGTARGSLWHRIFGR
jgi:excisionase family DNA binding protein